MSDDRSGDKHRFRIGHGFGFLNRKDVPKETGGESKETKSKETKGPLKLLRRHNRAEAQKPDSVNSGKADKEEPHKPRKWRRKGPDERAEPSRLQREQQRKSPDTSDHHAISTTTSETEERASQVSPRQRTNKSSRKAGSIGNRSPSSSSLAASSRSSIAALPKQTDIARHSKSLWVNIPQRGSSLNSTSTSGAQNSPEVSPHTRRPSPPGTTSPSRTTESEVSPKRSTDTPSDSTVDLDDLSLSSYDSGGSQNQVAGYFTKPRKQSKHGNVDNTVGQMIKRMKDVKTAIDKINEKHKVKKRLTDYALPAGIDVSEAIFRGGRAVPGGIIVASVAGVVLEWLTIIRDVHLNKQQAKDIYEDCVEEMETCVELVRRGVGDSQETWELLKADLEYVQQRCEKTCHDVMKTRQLSFSKRVVLRADIKRQLNIKDSGMYTGRNKMKDFSLFRILAILVEERSQNQRYHNEVMDRLNKILEAVENNDNNAMDTLKEISKLKYTNAGIQDSGSNAQITEPNNEPIRRASKSNATDKPEHKYIDTGTQMSDDDQMPGLRNTQSREVSAASVERVLQYVDGFTNDQKEEFSKIVDNFLKEQEEDRRQRKEGLENDIKDLDDIIEETRSSGILTVLDLKDDGIQKTCSDFESLKEELKAEKKRMDSTWRAIGNEDVKNLYGLERDILSKILELTELAVEELRNLLTDPRRRDSQKERKVTKLPRTASKDVLTGLASWNDRRNSASATQLKPPTIAFQDPTKASTRDHVESEEEESPVSLQNNRFNFAGLKKRPPASPMSFTSSRPDKPKKLVKKKFQEQLSNKAKLEREAKLFEGKLNHSYSSVLSQPLWTPGLVELGDVGYISCGSFIRLFNAHNPPSGIKRLGAENLRITSKKVSKAPNKVFRSIMTTRPKKLKGAFKGNFRDKVNMPTHLGGEQAFMYIENAIYECYSATTRKGEGDDSVTIVTDWFKANVEAILDIYDRVNEENLILVTGSMKARDYAFLLDQKPSSKQISFYVFDKREVGKEWGTFAYDTGKRTNGKTHQYFETEKLDNGSITHVSRVKRRNDPGTYDSVILQRLRIEKRIATPLTMEIAHEGCLTDG
ncbi:uncharacterized protein FOMMEDRAFT_152885 [Fomitiporia mediterranea MF3/22]|uniref:uncharacterized protein n=1 Tax=Fomitiporia mediterranea (strain MF3/22) TaxID=694068 RepID=UPI0004409A44|nr:uncharacterized protein FOMMEDRAFT_152885 [Fomitiporia mediterranea MF3/22]EJD05560.1 hypothetical protein FOMMEDRAFT_152885 [Fomitiporia mediterranea MF3/22]